MSRTILWVVLPVLLIIAVMTAFLASDPLRSLTGAVPPVEELTVERTLLDENGIALRVRAGGSEPMTIVQVQVDGAYWAFTQTPRGALERMETAWLQIPYPWVQGETHHLTLLTPSGVTFDHTIDVAVATPTANADTLRTFGMVGLLVGIVPVTLGMLFYPALRSGGTRTFQFVLALTVGLLAYLLIDTFGEALELAVEAAPGFQGSTLVWLVAALTFAVLMAVGRRKGRALAGVSLATSIALGIGLHNLGEGLAIGSAYATGSVALGSYLVLGFTLHNLTEGIGIVAPMVKQRPSLWVFAALAALAGLPAVAGVWIGSYAFSPHWAALAFAVGAGAILQVIIEVGALLARNARDEERLWLSGTALSGIGAGAAAMYATALLVQI
ncbi:Zinc transporter ZupT [Modicisalibacter muralis]|uniref:Zinc transporter ZupT n=1 Tax=Modicisalibacter muralis TaxID=119000 RepID=A0A1G9KDS1_9GAMM|nr:metal transporter [Halomonas muralis]SDL47604.1 Zinc transporter ZupT [Halomonas muralis]